MSPDQAHMNTDCSSAKPAPAHTKGVTQLLPNLDLASSENLTYLSNISQTLWHQRLSSAPVRAFKYLSHEILPPSFLPPSVPYQIPAHFLTSGIEQVVLMVPNVLHDPFLPQVCSTLRADQVLQGRKNKHLLYMTDKEHERGGSRHLSLTPSVLDFAAQTSSASAMVCIDKRFPGIILEAYTENNRYDMHVSHC